MQYLAHLGTNASLSVAELTAIISDIDIVKIGKNWLLFNCGKIPNIDHLGGTIRFAEVTGPIEKKDIEKCAAELLVKNTDSKRIEFGFSVLDGVVSLRQIGMETKSKIEDAGLKARFASTSRSEMATVLVRRKGVKEIMLVSLDSGKWLICRTIAVQDPDIYTFRDTKKPARNLRRGMLPPKLAQILLNLANAPQGSISFDPFCGTGTVLIEGINQGRKVMGSDIDEMAISESRQNLDWYSKIIDRELSSETVFQSDAGNLPDMENIGGMATEGTLGPLLQSVPTDAWVKQTQAQVIEILRRFYVGAAKLLPRGGRIAMSIPAYRSQRGLQFLPDQDFQKIIPEDMRLVKLLSDDVAKSLYPHLTKRGGIAVDRLDQMVIREIIILEKV